LLISSIHIINYPTVSAAVGGIGRILNMGYRERARQRADGTSGSFSVGVDTAPFGLEDCQRNFIGFNFQRIFSYSSLWFTANAKEIFHRNAFL